MPHFRISKSMTINFTVLALVVCWFVWWPWPEGVRPEPTCWELCCLGYGIPLVAVCGLLVAHVNRMDKRIMSQFETDDSQGEDAEE